MKETYISPALRDGVLDALGQTHIHIDGASNYPHVLEIVKNLEAQGNLGRFDQVLASVPGPQRELLPETYESHTPAVNGEETFDFFSTSLIKDRTDAIATSNRVARLLRGNAIVELEQVVALVDKDKSVWLPESAQMIPLTQEESEVPLSPSLPFEIHHGFNVPSESAKTFSLGILKKRCEEAQLMFGGWFVFDEEGQRSYWSNAFSEKTGPDLEHQVTAERAVLTNILETAGIEYASLKTIVERVVGIWHSETEKADS